MSAREDLLTPTNSEELARLICSIASEKLAEDIVALEVRELVSYTDFMVVMTARNIRQTKAVHDELREQLKSVGEVPTRVEGLEEADWILMDYLGCVIHIFTPELRDRYRLEQLWGEADPLELDHGD